MDIKALKPNGVNCGWLKGQKVHYGKDTWIWWWTPTGIKWWGETDNVHLHSCVQVWEVKSLLTMTLCCIKSSMSWSPHWSSKDWESWINNCTNTQGRPCHLFLSDEGRWGPKEKLKSYPWCCWLSCVYFIWLFISPTIASDGEKWSLLGPWLKWKGISGALHIQRLLQPLIELMTCSNALLSATCCAINNSSGNMADDLIHALSVFPPLAAALALSAAA